MALIALDAPNTNPNPTLGKPRIFSLNQKVSRPMMSGDTIKAMERQQEEEYNRAMEEYYQSLEEKEVKE